MGFLSHESAWQHLPSGGWGWRWVGDPDRGFDRGQPGGWAYNLLPYIEQTTAREKGKGRPEPEKRAIGRTVVESPLPILHCPSRRRAVAYPFVHALGFHNIERPAVAARSDYAACAGDQPPGLYGPGPGSLAEGDSPSYAWPKVEYTGVVFRRSEIQVASIRDGVSNTYMLGEGYLNPDHYATGKGTNDDQCLYVGFDRDTLRVACPKYPPRRDEAGHQSDHSFGSAHPSGWQAAFCDGSVRLISYQIDAEVHRRLGNRKDGLSIDDSQF